jgi:small subunit ribosomal protein S7
MARGKRTEHTRDIGVDHQYGSPVVQKLINMVMRQGKKNAARTIVYEAFDILTKKSSGNSDKALALFEKAFNNIVPQVEVRSRRVGGGVYQVPREVNPNRKQALGMRWLIQAAAERSNKTMGARLASELLDAVDNKGGAVKKKMDVQRMAEANRAFSHYAW